MMNAGFTEILLAALALTLVVVAIVDVRTYTISNPLNAAIALAAPLYWWSIGLPLWPDAAIQVAIAGAVFAMLAITFYVGMMGGGDVKLAAALALWFSPASTLKFLVIMSIAGGVVTLVVLVADRLKRDTETDQNRPKPEVPYGVAIAVGGLWVLAQRFLNHFA